MGRMKGLKLQSASRPGNRFENHVASHLQNENTENIEFICTNVCQEHDSNLILSKQKDLLLDKEQHVVMKKKLSYGSNLLCL